MRGRFFPSASTRNGRQARRDQRGARRVTFLVAVALATAFISAYRPARPLGRTPFVTDSASGELALNVAPEADAYGVSGSVWMRTALPGEPVEYPVSIDDSAGGVRYAWESVPDLVTPDSARVVEGPSLTAPSQPGFYQLVLERHGARRLVQGPTLAVLVPFDEKRGAALDGYRIGYYRGERAHPESADLPEGFLRVTPDEMDLPISRHLRLGDFLTQDGQRTWPRFAAVDPRVLDKLELVLERIGRSLPGGNIQLTVHVHSAFRTPAHNSLVRRAAPDSRHQFGDAVDVAIDADGDGRITTVDARRVAVAVDSVEAEHPDLAGGMGLYVSRRYPHPYVHIDARGERVRWRG